MAQVLKATIYGANSNDWNVPDGVQMAFSTNQIVIRELPADTYYSGVECFTAIQLLPTAPSPIQPVYYSDSTFSDLVDAANAALITP